MTNGVKTKQTQIEGKRHASSKMRLAQRAQDQVHGRWVPTPFRIGNLGIKVLTPYFVIFFIAMIITLFT